MKNMIKPVIVLTVIAFICTAALAGVNSLTRDIIANAAAEKKAAVMRELFPDEEFSEVEVSEETLKQHSASGLYKTKSGKGYIAEVSTSGYGGEIKMMVSFSQNGDILGVKVLSHEETNGIGTRVVADEKYLSNYIGKNAAEPSGIDAVSGATVSSNAVLAGVNNAANLITNTLGGGEK